LKPQFDSINARSPNDWGDVDDLWWAYAYDPQGKLQGVPRRVPEGWYFATDHAPDDWRAPDDWYFATEGKPPRH
jgi:hypothetical protein